MHLEENTRGLFRQLVFLSALQQLADPPSELHQLIQNAAIPLRHSSPTFVDPTNRIGDALTI